MKACNKCGVIQPSSCYSTNRNRSDRLHNMCKSCMSIAGRDYRRRLRLKNG